MSIARFKTIGQFDQSYVQAATVEVNRDANLISVRPKVVAEHTPCPFPQLLKLFAGELLEQNYLKRKGKKLEIKS